MIIHSGFRFVQRYNIGGGGGGAELFPAPLSMVSGQDATLYLLDIISYYVAGRRSVRPCPPFHRYVSFAELWGGV